MPNFDWEIRLGGIVCGVDEVGRGPLAGPVVAAAVIFDRGQFPGDLSGLDNSKVLSAAERRAFAQIITRTARIGIGAANVAEIDRLNILQATMLAMTRAVAALRVVPDAALVDGNCAPRLGCRVETLIKGNSISLSIAAASVIAKVVRDRAMAQLSVRYTRYGWDTNVGYPTAAHRAALVDFGVTPHHRRSFAPVREVLERDH